METNKFFTSVVFGMGQTHAIPTDYIEPTLSERPVSVLPYKLGGNVFFKKDCHFLVFVSKNKQLILDSTQEKHTVSNDLIRYNLTAFLEEKGGEELDNGVEIASFLPKGLVMTKLKAFTDFDVYTFNGMSIMLFDTLLKEE